MRIHRISNVEDTYYDTFVDMYSKSFPVYEQRNEAQHKSALSNPLYHLDGFMYEDILAGFLAWWDFSDYVYVEHFAVNPSMRGRNLGTDILKNFLTSQSPKPVLLEIDPPGDEISLRRREFYERLGFVSNEYSHRHPAYDTSYDPHELVLLSSPRTISQEEYDRFNKELAQTVMESGDTSIK